MDSFSDFEKKNWVELSEVGAVATPSSMLKDYNKSGSRQIKAGKKASMYISFPKTISEARKKNLVRGGGGGDQAGQYSEMTFMMTLEKLVSGMGGKVRLMSEGKSYSSQQFKQKVVPSNLGKIKLTSPKMKKWGAMGEDGAKLVFERMKEVHGHLKKYEVDIAHMGSELAKSEKSDVVISMRAKSGKELESEFKTGRLSLKASGIDPKGTEKGVSGMHQSSSIAQILPGLVQGNPYLSELPRNLESLIGMSEENITKMNDQIKEDRQRILGPLNALRDFEERFYDEEDDDEFQEEIISYHKKAFGSDFTIDEIYKRTVKLRNDLEKEYITKVIKKSGIAYNGIDELKKGFVTTESYIYQIARKYKIPYAESKTLSAHMHGLNEYFRKNLNEQIKIGNLEKLNDSEAIEEYHANVEELMKILATFINKMGKDEKTKRGMVEFFVGGGHHQRNVDFLGMGEKNSIKNKKFEYENNYDYSVITTLWNSGYRDYINSLFVEEVELKAVAKSKKVTVYGIVAGEDKWKVDITNGTNKFFIINFKIKDEGKYIKPTLKKGFAKKNLIGVETIESEAQKRKKENDAGVAQRKIEREEKAAQKIKNDAIAKAKREKDAKERAEKKEREDKEKAENRERVAKERAEKAQRRKDETEAGQENRARERENKARIAQETKERNAAIKAKQQAETKTQDASKKAAKKTLAKVVSVRKPRSPESVKLPARKDPRWKSNFKSLMSKVTPSQKKEMAKDIDTLSYDEVLKKYIK